jgi:hypothetical protein
VNNTIRKNALSLLKLGAFLYANYNAVLRSIEGLNPYVVLSIDGNFRLHPHLILKKISLFNLLLEAQYY